MPTNHIGGERPHRSDLSGPWRQTLVALVPPCCPKAPHRHGGNRGCILPVFASKENQLFYKKYIRRSCSLGTAGRLGSTEHAQPVPTAAANEGWSQTSEPHRPSLPRSRSGMQIGCFLLRNYAQRVKGTGLMCYVFENVQGTTEVTLCPPAETSQRQPFMVSVTRD